MRTPELTAISGGHTGSTGGETKPPVDDTSESPPAAGLEAAAGSAGPGAQWFSCSGGGFRVSVGPSLDVEFDFDLDPGLKGGENADVRFALTVLTLIVSSIAARFEAATPSSPESPRE